MADHPLHSFLTAVPIAMIVIGQDGRVVAMNTAASTLLGPGLIGRHYITALRQPAILDCIETTQQDGAPRKTRFLGRDGERDTTYDVHCAAVTWPSGQSGIAVTFDDITDVASAGQMRRDFIANVSHELRTPLTAMTGFIETLRGAARDDAAARDRFLAIMEREAARMNRLVMDLLSLSRVEAEERQRPTDPVDLRGLAEACIQTMKSVSGQQDVALELQTEGQNFTVPGDADQLRQVLYNLTENAIKYGGTDGKVTVTLTELKNDPRLRGDGIQVDVIDQGDGIPDIHLARLTERFYRIDTHRSREVGGTGLGLAIVKHVLNRHRGRLHIQSQPGKGSVFSAVLPRT